MVLGGFGWCWVVLGDFIVSFWVVLGCFGGFGGLMQDCPCHIALDVSLHV